MLNPYIWSKTNLLINFIIRNGKVTFLKYICRNMSVMEYSKKRDYIYLHINISNKFIYIFHLVMKKESFMWVIYFNIFFAKCEIKIIETKLFTYY